MNPIIIGNITNVKWHYMNKKMFKNTLGHVRETYNSDMDMDMDTNMDTDKYYAYISINNNKLVVRNVFDSNHPKGFNQKNTYFPDELFELGMLRLEDGENKLVEYIQGNEHGRELYFCVEYTLIEGLTPDIINYIIELQITCNQLQQKKSDKKHKKSGCFRWC